MRTYAVHTLDRYVLLQRLGYGLCLVISFGPWNAHSRHTPRVNTHTPRVNTYHIVNGVITGGCHGPTLMDRSINISHDGPRPGPAHHIFIRWAAARPALNNFSEDGPRPGPVYHISFFSRLCPAHDIGREAHETRALPGPAHPKTWASPCFVSY